VLAGQFNVRGLVGQYSGAVPTPFTFIATVDPELVKVAEPATEQLPPVMGDMFDMKESLAVTVWVEAVAVKVVLPGYVVCEPLLHVTVKL
jgi:hypothetical protein